MSKSRIYYDVTPKVVPADRESEILIRPRFSHCRFDPALEYGIAYFPTEEFSERSGWPEANKPAFRIEDGALRVRQYFEGEQEHVLLLQTVSGDERRVVAEFRVYSLEADLLARGPRKGDLHLHSHRSDGIESPAYVAASCRKIGLDFMALTDHHQRGPSLEAIEAFEGLETDLRIYPGEEVHPPGNPVHMVNFGGAFSVNEFFADKEAYLKAVKLVEDGLGELPPGVDRHQYASCVWCFDKIREAGGLGVFCHPYWFTGHRYAPAGSLTSHLLSERPFDALEVIGGYELHNVESNHLQVARYHQERAAGRSVPIVGASDSHGCERESFGWYYTVVFSPSADLADLRDGVKEEYAVAAEALPGETPHFHGPFRLVKFTFFLQREVFPRHDELCREEGRLMLDHLAGDNRAAELLSRMKGRTDAWMRDCGFGAGAKT